MKKKRLVFGASVLIALLVFMQTSAVFATSNLEDVTTWYWTGDTNIRLVAVGDVDDDTNLEIVTGGYYYDGTHYVAQLCTWNGATLALEDVTTWRWGDSTYIRSIAVGDVDEDGKIEIVTGGHFYDGTRNNAQLCVWDGATLALEYVTTWYWTGSTTIYSIAVGDVDDDSKPEIVTGGHFYDGTRNNAQVCVWKGSNLALEDVTTWYWTNDTVIYSVDVGDVDADSKLEIVTGGYFLDGIRWVAQLCVWNGGSLALESVTTWYWTSHTDILSVAVGDVDGDTQMEIVSGGTYWDYSRYNAQLCVWDGATLGLEDVTTWYWTGSTGIYSVDVDDVDGNMEIVTGGFFNDGTRHNAQLCVWDGVVLGLEDVKTWYWISYTYITSIVVNDVDKDGAKEIVTGGDYWDGTRYNAQLCVWG